MKTIKDIANIYDSKIDPLDLELLIASTIGKPREFVLAHPEHSMNSLKIENLKLKIARRMRGEPLAYILGQKEFFGLNFKVTKNTLIPRPETELLVEEALNLLRSMLRNKLRNTLVVDIGTGSGNIIISIANELKKTKLRIADYKLLAIDISDKSLLVAKQNAKNHGMDKKIKFFRGNLLEPILKAKSRKLKAESFVIIANLPYLSKNIYSRVRRDIKKYEPKSALLSGADGLEHYKKLLKQIKKLSIVGCRLSVVIEISPEQKSLLPKLLGAVLPDAKISFQKDLAEKWRLARITIN